ncbi:MAG: transposase [Novosphingobium sp.]
MPRVIAIEDGAIGSLAECDDALTSTGFNPEDEGNLHHAALQLRRLGNNRTFLGDMLIDELKRQQRDDAGENSYGPQVIMLRPSGKGNFFIRAVIWPSECEHSMRASGGGAFVYSQPHDHNFNFLTVGYFGPGYWSNYYEYEYDDVVGYRGEPVSLRHIERARLEQGKIMLYRAHVDVHDQAPADALSISLNIMHTSGAQAWLDQYSFDLENHRLGRIISNGSSEAFLRIAVGMGCGEAKDLASTFGRSHPSDRMRLAAWGALASVETDAAARDGVWGAAEFAGSRLVAAEAKQRRLQMA